MPGTVRKESRKEPTRIEHLLCTSLCSQQFMSVNFSSLQQPNDGIAAAEDAEAQRRSLLSGAQSQDSLPRGRRVVVNVYLLAGRRDRFVASAHFLPSQP